MNANAQNHSAPRQLPVRWLDAPAFGPVAICRRRSRRAPIVARGRWEPPRSTGRNYGGGRFPGGLRAFTLLELMVVIAIIGFIAAMALPHIGGMTRSNSMTTATFQLLDDISYARQRAMVNRSTVYMVFAPPSLWDGSGASQAVLSQVYNPAISNLVTHQYSSYALVSLGSVGDQPGRHYARYLTDWKSLPDGVFFAPFEFVLTNLPSPFYIYTTNTLTGVVVTTTVTNWSSVTIPFPSLPSTLANSSVPFNVPCIGFSPNGALTTPYVNQYIALARGSVLYSEDTNGLPLLLPANVVETPAGNDTNNANVIQIDWMTARPTLVQNKFQ